MQSFRSGIGLGICLLLGAPAFAAGVYNLDLANQYSSGALKSSATFSTNAVNQNISVIATGYAQNGGSGAYQAVSLYEKTSAVAGAEAGLGLSDPTHSNQISQNGHEFVQLDISNILSTARSTGVTNLGISLTGLNGSSSGSYFLFGGSTKGSFLGSTLIGYGSNDSTINLNLTSLIAKNFDFITILSPSGGVLVSSIRATTNPAMLMSPVAGAVTGTPEPSTSMLFMVAALAGAFLMRRKLNLRHSQS
jgi:hypothetical protein